MKYGINLGFDFCHENKRVPKHCVIYLYNPNFFRDKNRVFCRGGRLFNVSGGNVRASLGKAVARGTRCQSEQQQQETTFEKVHGGMIV